MRPGVFTPTPKRTNRLGFVWRNRLCDCYCKTWFLAEYNCTNPDLSMKILFLLATLVIAGPAYAGRDDFGMGAASVACAMLDSGYSRYQVEKVLNRLERDIINSGITERQQSQMASGFNYQAARNNCSLRYRE